MRERRSTCLAAKRQTFSAAQLFVALDFGVEITPAILLRKTKLTETSLVVTWFTQASGRIKTVAKGARQPKSRFSGVLDLFFECEIQYLRSRKSELHILRELVLLSAYEAIRIEYSRVALASYFVELIELVTEPDHPAPEIYTLLKRACTHLNGHAATKRALLHFESELVRFLGIQHPDLTAAIAIGRAYHRLPQSRTALVKSLPDKLPADASDPGKRRAALRPGTRLDA